jgi:hypothetical protein
MTHRTSLGRFAIALTMWLACVASAQQPQAHFQVTSSSFTDNGRMPPRLTCEGANISPQLQWPAPPQGTVNFAILMEDTDAPAIFTHWLAYNLPPETRNLPEGASTPSKRLMRAAEGINNFGRTGYGGPCPPESQTHHYVFHVYALDASPQLPVGATRQQLEAAMKGHVLAEGRITGLYTRGGA